MSQVKQFLKSKKAKWAVFVFIILVPILAYYLLALGADQNKTNGPKDNKPTQKQQNEASKPKPIKAPLNLQPELNAWLKNNPGVYSVVMRDLKTGKIIAEHNEDKQYFMASLYKLYVAYLALLDIQDKKHKLSEKFLTGWTRQQCIDKMIRISHSPCGEKYMAELNRQDIEDRLENYGLGQTDFGSFVTSAADAELILQRLHKNQELKRQYSQILLNAMEGQIYRDTIAKGAPAEGVVANKVGFRGHSEYHDVAIVTMPGGSAYTLSILSQSAGTKRLADLARTLLAALPG